MNLRNKILGACLACAMLAASAHAAPFLDPLEVPAPMSPLASKSIVQAVARAGSKLVAVGQRGHVLVSDDGGKSWRQSSVPVSSDLTSVFFVDERKGWAVGHDGVILHTSNAGATWSRQLDGHRAGALLLEAYPEDASAKDAQELLSHSQSRVDGSALLTFVPVSKSARRARRRTT